MIDMLNSIGVDYAILGNREFDFGPGAGENGQSQEVDFTGQEPIGKCPKCQSNVYDAGMAYMCEKATGPNKTCDFRSGKIILQQAVERAQMTKLLASGKTDLLPKFISKKGRPFAAYLVVGEGGKVGFEFEPRKTPNDAPRRMAHGTDLLLAFGVRFAPGSERRTPTA